jgi:hypothetical protein
MLNGSDGDGRTGALEAAKAAGIAHRLPDEVYAR